jgi:hypothetical protein
MRVLPIEAAIVALALLLGGCHSKKSEPLPGPQSTLDARNPAAMNAALELTSAAGRADALLQLPRWACSTAVSAGDSSMRCLRVETREVDGMNSGKPSGVHAPMATLSRAAGTPAEGAETT